MAQNNNFALTDLKFHIFPKLNYLQLELKSKVDLWKLLKGSLVSMAAQTMWRHIVWAEIEALKGP